MILHVFNNQKKFSKGYFKLLKKNNFDMNDFELVHYGLKDDYFEKEVGIRTYFIRNFILPFSNLKLYFKLKKADRIIIHSLASPWLLIYIALNRNIANKVTWVIWGKDLYFYKLLDKPRFYHKAYEWLRKRAIPKIKRVVVILKEEYNLLTHWYSVNPECIECNDLYHYCLDMSEEKSLEEKKNKYTILVGNSASKSNRHIDALKKLKLCDNQIETIYCPLSYGGKKSYVKQVIAIGEACFGKRFIPITDFLPQHKYYQMIQKVDIGVFNYLRQEGLGNIWSLIFRKKTVYIVNTTTTYAFFKRVGVKVNDINSIVQAGELSLLDNDVTDENDKHLRKVLSEEICADTWRKIIYG